MELSVPDYRSVPDDIEERARHYKRHDLMRMSGWMNCGCNLARSKDEMTQSEFDGYISEMIGISHRSALRQIQFYRYAAPVIEAWAVSEASGTVDVEKISFQEAFDLVTEYKMEYTDECAEDDEEEEEDDEEDEPDWKADAIEALPKNIRKQYTNGDLKGKFAVDDTVLKKLSTMPLTDILSTFRDVRTGKEKTVAHAVGVTPRVKHPYPENRAPRGLVKDKHGRAVPTKELVDVFQDERIKESVKVLKKFKGIINSIRGIHAMFLDTVLIHERLDEIESLLANARPAYVCPACNGDGCTPCRNGGWMPAARYHDYQMNAGGGEE